jgi:formylglycine-generating enzyme required for sulfatase activity
VYDGDDLARGTGSWVGDAWVERVEARSGPALLEIDRLCGPSIIALRRLPGYHERANHTVVRIRVPTCRATTIDTIVVPAGPFIANVDTNHGEGAADEPATLPEFAIDRTEVTRAAFAIYEEMLAQTGESAAPLPNVPALESAGPRLPVVGVSYETARGYCRFLGKDLPTIEQWQKTVRGGRELADGPNPRPDRQTPWLAATSMHPTNVSYDPSTEAVSPVGSFADDRSPYGVVDLAGNVLEWTLSRPPATSRMHELRIVAGASWATPASTQRYEVRWRNTRPDRYLDFTLGFRCAR